MKFDNLKSGSKKRTGLLPYELRRLVRSPFLWITLLILIVIGLPEIVRLGEWTKVYLASNLEGEAVSLDISAYEYWMGSEVQWYTGRTLYEFLLPLFAVTPYALSFLKDQKSGYLKTLVLKKGKRAFFRTRYWMVFFSGFAVIFSALLLNLLMTACVMPLIKIDPSTMFMPTYNTECLFVSCYYDHPFIYALLTCTINGIYGGWMAVLALAVSQLTDFTLTVWAAPFLIYISEWYVGCSMTAYDWIPISHLSMGNISNQMVPCILVIWLILFAVTWLIAVEWGSRKDVF